jgi:hypothetical protein
MSDPNFPILHDNWLPDSAQHGETPEDPTLRSDIEGGYVITRPKHTRKPRRTWKGGYKDLISQDKTLLDDFWDAVTGAVIFNWTNPESSVVYQVRFTKPIEWSYTGIGPTRRWSCSFEVMQA